MSLQVWLPLINDIKNQGLDDMTQFVNNGATIASEGGFGHSHYLNKVTLSCPNFTLLESTDSFSACCWVKFTAFPSDSNAYCICLNTSSASTYKFILGVYSNNGTTASFRLNMGNSVGTLQLNTWYHLAICVNGTTGYMYINGELKKTVTDVKQQSATNLIIGGRSSNTAGTSFTGLSAPGYYNDIRIYDHCLSKKEVAELAKGLIFHMPLNNNGYGGRNIITTMSSGGRTALIDKYTLEADFSQNADTYGYFNVSPALELDKPYTLSFDVSNFPEGSKWTWQLWNKNDYSFAITGNGHYVYTFTPVASKLPTGYSLTKFLFDDGSRTNPANLVQFSNFKLEAGTQETPWAPNQSNFFETDFQIDETSGYNRSGQSVQFMDISSDTPKYNVSTVWKDSTDFINIPNFFDLEQTISEITICGWFKTNTLNGTAPNLFNFGANNFIRGRISGANSLWSYWNINGTKFGTTATTETTTDNNWHHYAFSFKNGIIKTYFDGALKNTSDQSATGTVLLCSQITNWGLGGYTPTGEKFLGQQSDFRVYATALADEDILELAEVRPGVDKNGNFYISKLQETSAANPLITKEGISDVPDAFYELDSEENFKIGKENIIANYIYEI